MLHNITGTYSFIEDNKVIYESKNLLTKFGKRYFTTYLAGINQYDKKDIAIGIGSTAATTNDNRLEFEFYKSQVEHGTIDIQTNNGVSTYSIVFKTTLPVDVGGVISEAGIFPSTSIGNTDYSNKYISTFENVIPWTDSSGTNPSFVTTPSPSIGLGWFSITSPSSSSKEYFLKTNFDISGYSVNDSLSLAFNQQDTNLDYVFVRFYSSSTDYYEIRFAGSTIGNHISNLSLTNLYNSSYKSGNPDATSIINVSVGTKSKSTGLSTTLLDGLRINDEDTFNADFGLISRSVLSSPIIKSVGKQMDIEYRLDINF